MKERAITVGLTLVAIVVIKKLMPGTAASVGL